MTDKRSFMASSFLATKLRIPVEPSYSVQRARLNNVLEAAIARNRLILLAAPAGYGKTTQLAQWARSSRFPIVWLSTGEEDNDLIRFLRYLLAGWEQVQPDIAEKPLGLLLDAQSPDEQAALIAFVNAANEVSDQIVFVIDDYHGIAEESIHKALTFLLDHAPSNLHFVLASRGEPPLPLARYRARGEMLELRADNLSFLPEETRNFLEEGLGLELAAEEVETLQAQLEGWIAGLQLVALSRRQTTRGTEKLPISGRQRFIAGYLREDVLDHLPVDKQRFLLQTSILDRLCGPLCEAVTGEERSQEMLETLEREDLFLLPLDNNREWFRYHQLFADFLRGELKRQFDEVAPLHRKAARWYLDQELPEQAFRHAVDGEDAGLVTQILERYLVVKLLGGEVRVVKGWLNALPDSWQTRYPTIALARAGILLATGQFEACGRLLDEVERLALASAEDAELHRARVIAMRCNIACFQNDMARAESLADQALKILNEKDLDFRAGIYGALGDTYRRNGHWEQAKLSYLKLLGFTEAPTFRVQAVHIYGALADLALRQGHLQSAAKYWVKALDSIQQRENRTNFPLPLTGWVYIRMGELYYEWNERKEAWEHLSKGLERAELGGDVRSLIAGYLLSAQLELSEGNLEEASAYLEQARPYVEGAQFAHWTDRFERIQLELWLALDQQRTAARWVDSKLNGGALENHSQTEVGKLSLARALIAKGGKESFRRALALLEELITRAGGEGRTAIQIESLALEALLHGERSEEASAMTSLERALRLARPEGYVRLFADLGLPMGRLLQEARSREVMPAYVEKLLSTFGDDIPSSGTSKVKLPDPLTNREEEILELLAAGLTNPEIAKKLFVSAQTVKKHTSHIYKKLGVHSRTEAASRARELNFLD